MKTNRNETRAHHYVPQCWLAGFTDTGEKDGKLWVTDLKRKKQWRCKPSDVGHRRDFYRIDDPALSDPLAIEKLFSQLEDKLAPVLRALLQERRGPRDGTELGTLLEYMSIQWIRVPTFRAIVGNTVFSHFSTDILSSPEVWEDALRKASVPIGNPGTDYSTIVAAMATGNITFSGQPAFYLKHGVQLVGEIDACLKKMRWGWLISVSGQFIGFDSPVALDGERGQPVGFKNAGVVIYPVNRHLLLYGTYEAVEAPAITTKLIARHNTFAMLSADEQVYSHRPDFHWVDKANKCQNDWSLFSRDDFG